MPNPIQFSIRRMLGAMACACVSVASFSAMLQHVYDKEANLGLFLFFISWFSMSVAIGVLLDCVMTCIGYAFLIIGLLILISLFLPAVRS